MIIPVGSNMIRMAAKDTFFLMHLREFPSIIYKHLQNRTARAVHVAAYYSHPRLGEFEQHRSQIARKGPEFSTINRISVRHLSSSTSRRNK